MIVACTKCCEVSCGLDVLQIYMHGYLQLWKVGFDGLNDFSLSVVLKVNHSKKVTSLLFCYQVVHSPLVTFTGAKLEKCI